VLIALFVWWEARSRARWFPMRFFRRRAFSTANVTSMLMSLRIFGSVFLLAQFFQVVQGYSPFQAGLRTLTWTAMPILVAPWRGSCPIGSGADRFWSRDGMMAGALAWIAAVARQPCRTMTSSRHSPSPASHVL